MIFFYIIIGLSRYYILDFSKILKCKMNICILDCAYSWYLFTFEIDFIDRWRIDIISRVTFSIYIEYMYFYKLKSINSRLAF